ncbi:hypothetical protein A3A67_05440 [Candidatus Peribacteria bacterium RIFCSPLOWO2_01_FULL_51_18]|nr:MAG: hypothetical protein A3A67_05440 [Candidatus Peribacteria bacterium RIFCSPLOWO2_01_FULL_51_18]
MPELSHDAGTNSVATPPESVTVPSPLELSWKTTLPVADGVTVAVRVTLCDSKDGLGDDVSTMLVAVDRSK